MHMFHKIKMSLGIVVLLATSFWIGNKIFRYFTHQTPPEISLIGLERGGSYAKQLCCTVKSDGSYKVGYLYLFLDGKPFDFARTNRIGSQYFERSVTIDLQGLADGQHTLDLEAVDSSYNRNKIKESWNFIVDNTPLRAGFLESEYRVSQGKTLHLKIQANKKLLKGSIKFLNQSYNFYPETDDSTLYECFVPIDCEESPCQVVAVAQIEDLVHNICNLSCTIQVNAFPFKKQRGFSVSQEKLDNEKEMSMNTKILREAIDRWVKESPSKKLWNGPFEYPIEVQKMTTPFGEIRMTPERGRYLHKGVDLINRPKCVVWASQHGKVIIKDRFLMTGNTVVLDHGRGIFTLYAHLEDYADISVGDMVKKGNPVGRLGMTGYATGYHLHWELLVNGVPVDPLEWLEKVY
jgi:hypothetical protein